MSVSLDHMFLGGNEERVRYQYTHRLRMFEHEARISAVNRPQCVGSCQGLKARKQVSQHTHTRQHTASVQVLEILF